MTVREAGVATLRQSPILSWSSASFAVALALHQVCCFKLEHMLTRTCRGHVKARANVGGRLRSARLQLKQDPILTAVVVLTHDVILETRCYLK